MTWPGWFRRYRRQQCRALPRGLLALALLMLSWLSACGERPPSVCIAGPSLQPPAEWPLNARISTPITINGHDASMGLDTGAPFQFLFNPQKFGLVLDPVMTASSARLIGGLSFTTGADVVMFGESIHKVPFALSDLPDPRYDGLLPWHTLQHVVTEIDWSDWRFCFHGGAPSAHDGWQMFAIDPLASRLWMIIPMTNGPPLRIMLDTGDPGSVLVDAATWRQVRDPGRETCSLTSDSYRLWTQDVSWVHTLSFGPLTLHDLPVSESFPNDVEQREHPVRFGLYAMRQFDMIIDGPRARIYLRPTRRPPEPMRFNNLGATFPPAPSGDLVAHVVPGTPAARAGVLDGDILLAMDGLRTDTHPTRHADLLFAIGIICRQPAGTVVRMQMRRGHDVLVCDATLRDILGSGNGSSPVP